MLNFILFIRNYKSNINRNYYIKFGFIALLNEIGQFIFEKHRVRCATYSSHKSKLTKVYDKIKINVFLMFYKTVI